MYYAETQLWEVRLRNVLKGKKSSSGEHNEEYVVWYSTNTIMQIGRARRDEIPQRNYAKRPQEHDPSSYQKRAWIFWFALH